MPSTESTTKFILLVAILLFATIVKPMFAKRTPPRAVPPVVLDGVKYMVLHGAFQKGKNRSGGYIEAYDLKTEKKLWDLQIYKINYDPTLEKDAQDVFITSLSAQNDKLLVVTERGDRYEVDPKTRTAKKLLRSP